MGINLHSEILRAELEKLVGLPLWGVGLAAGMLALFFGNRYTVTTGSGREIEKGDFGLHIQGAWRIVREDEVVVGYSDYLDVDRADPAAVQTFYQFLESAFPEPPCRVEAIASLRAGAFSLRLEDGLYVEAFPSFSGSDPQEFWRLLSREPKQHFVVGSGGIEVS